VHNGDQQKFEVGQKVLLNPAALLSIPRNAPYFFFNRTVTVPMNERVKAPYKHLLMAGLIFISGAFLSIYLWEHQRHNEKELVNQRFLQEANLLKKDIQQNLNIYGQLANDLSGLFSASEQVTQSEWNTYIDTVKKFTRQYPGIVSVGFSASASSKEIVSFSTAFNNHDSNPVGLDLLTYAHRKAAIERSNRTGAIELANQLRPTKEGISSYKTPYFGLFSPVYRKDEKTIFGHVFVEIDFYSMITRFFNGEDKGVMMKVFFKKPDGSNQILYETSDESITMEKPESRLPSAPLFSQMSSIEFNKTTWDIYFYSTPTLDASVDKKGPAIVFFSCILISFLGSIVVWSLNTVNERSELLDLSNKQISMLNKDLENKIKIRTKELERANFLLTKNNDAVSLKNELLSLMQACVSVKDVLILAGEFFKRMFPENNGRIYFYNRNSLLLDLVSCWGEEGRKAPEIIKMSDCFALHYFHSYRVKGIKSEMICGHMLQEKNTMPYFCLPIIDTENVFGLITLGMQYDGQEHLKESVENIEKSISLTCINLDLKRQLQYDAIHDPLTGLYNRRYFEENLLREIMKSRRVPTVFNILMIDVDNFKQINDQYGHLMGDEVLKSISSMFKHDVRVSDVACRFGGEEFVIMMETSVEYGYKRAEQLRKNTVALTFTSGGKTLSGVTISIGLSAYPKHGDSMEKLIKNSDEALYRAKSLGKNQVIIFGEWTTEKDIEKP
jgi:diguanylate cyclase (GGDEF)-like protein